MTARQSFSLFLLAVVVICNWIFVFLALLMVPISGAAAESDSATGLMVLMALLAVAGAAVSVGIVAPDENPVVIRTAYVGVFFLIFSACCFWHYNYRSSGRRSPPIEAIVVGTLAIADLLTLALNRPLRRPPLTKD